jgi:hypothetical protein
MHIARPMPAQHQVVHDAPALPLIGTSPRHGGVDLSQTSAVRGAWLLRRFAQGKTDRKIAVEIGGTEWQVSAQRERLLRTSHSDGGTGCVRCYAICELASATENFCLSERR